MWLMFIEDIGIPFFLIKVNPKMKVFVAMPMEHSRGMA
jgi:hypothetical protein